MKKANRFLPAALFFALLVVYLLTLAPGLTWANRGADGGDLITAAATGGVPHPTGYPVWLLAADLFQLLPIGSLAWRTNLLSAFAAAGASMVICKLVIRSLSTSNYLAGFVAGLAFGLSPLIWSQAVITEVYTLHAFFIILLLYWSLFPPIKDNGKSDLILGVISGIAMGNHFTTILFLPVIFGSTLSIQDKHWHIDARCFLRRLSGLGIGLLIYLVIPLRALSDPPVNWGDPVTFGNFLWLVSGRLYQQEIFGASCPLLWERFRSAVGFLLTQLGFLGFVTSVVGSIFYLRSGRLLRSSVWMVIAFFIFAVIYNTEDSFLYLVPAVVSFAIWLGLGVDGLMRLAARKVTIPGWVPGILLLMWVIYIAVGSWAQVDASRDARAEQFGRLVMTQIPENALIFARGDPALFSLWYFHFALHQRPDLSIVAMDLLHYDWYRDTLRSTYPSLSVPEPYPFPDTILAANPDRPVCIVEYDGQANIRCP